MASDSEKREKRLQTFRTLVSERTAKLNVAWIQIEQGIGDRETVNELKRILHTLKGDASLLAFKAIADIAHAVEDLVVCTAEAGRLPGQDAGQTILDALDTIMTLAERAPEDPAPEADAICAALQRHTANAQQAQPAEPPESGDSPRLPKSPKSHDPNDQSAGDSPVPPSEPQPPGESPLPAKYPVRVNPRQLDRMRDIIGELLLARTRLATSATALHEQRHGVPESAVPGHGQASTHDDLLRSIEGQLRDDVLRISNLVTALDEITRELRMVEVSMLFDRYPLAVHRISRELGRQVALVCHGEAVEADRDVLEALDDALLHLVRNALDHGIEPPDVRRAMGKSPVGTLTLRARVVSDSLLVEVGDDGAGIDVERVRAMIVERGLVDESTARGISDHEVLQKLFLPNASTRPVATDISGRGVGLDVVYRTVRDRGGTVEISTRPGVGTTFRVTVPIRAAISSVLLFRVGEGSYALPSNAVVGLAELDDLAAINSIDGPAVRYEDSIVPLIALEPVLGESPGAMDSRRAARVIIARYGGRHEARPGNGMVALTGSHSHLQREAVLKPVGTLLREDKLIVAGLGLEDGSVALVLNIDAVMHATHGAALHEELPAVLSPPSSQPPAHTVLVAEDSPVVRDLIVESLRAHGLHVLEAPDGQDALERLAQNPGIDLLVTDVEMPRLDGLGLIARMRARGGRRIPAIVVSTRGSDADKVAAVEVGADAYLVKSDFSSETLWSMVSRFLG